jgi:hypothetical protein
MSKSKSVRTSPARQKIISKPEEFLALFTEKYWLITTENEEISVLSIILHFSFPSFGITYKKLKHYYNHELILLGFYLIQLDKKGFLIWFERYRHNEDGFYPHDEDTGFKLAPKFFETLGIIQKNGIYYYR